jgi:hypothetical protein
MKTNILCQPYVWEQPFVLFTTGIYPTNQGQCVSENVNHVVLVSILVLLFSIASVRYFGSFIPVGLWILLYMVVAGPSIFAITQTMKLREGYQTSGAFTTAVCSSPNPDKMYTEAEMKEYAKRLSAARRSGQELPSVDVIGEGNEGIASEALNSKRTYPTARNPFMNVLIDEIKYNPTRPPAASIFDPSIKISLDDFFRTEFNCDPTDVFGRNQSQRQFIPMPSTSIPNDQDSYQNWLYKIPGKTCKEGGREACLPGTDGGPITWLNADS